MDQFLAYMRTHKRRIVAPIGGKLQENSGYESDLTLHCCSFIEMCKAFGLETMILPSSGLEKVVEGQVKDHSTLCVASFKKAKESFLKAYRENLEVMRKEVTNGFLGGGCFGPTTVAAEMIGVENFIRKSVKSPEWIDYIISEVSDLILEIAQICETSGVDFFWVAEPTAVLLSPKYLRRYAGKPLNRIFETLKVPPFLHVCGDTTIHTEELVRTGAKCLSLDYCVDLTEMRQRVPDDVWLMGNVDPMILYNEKGHVVDEAIRKPLNDMANNLYYIASTGCLLPHGTPEENLKKFYEHSYSAQLTL